MSPAVWVLVSVCVCCARVSHDVNTCDCELQGEESDPVRCGCGRGVLYDGGAWLRRTTDTNTHSHHAASIGDTHVMCMKWVCQCVCVWAVP